MATSTLRSLVKAPVIPVLTIQSVDHALPLAQALAAGGLTTLEVTLRTDAALTAIRMLASSLGSVRVGAGTVLSPQQGEAAISLLEAASQIANQPIQPGKGEAIDVTG